ncbi:MAG: four helix bundle protein [Clostridiales bacterium]|nr:four helix bundle protein [Clostridiales bacterium]
MNYKKLIVWQLAKSLALDTYRITKTFPEKERFGLISQMTRAAVSVPSNIAEGTSRRSAKDQIRFIEIAYGSLMELSCQIEISHELGYLDQEAFEEINAKIENLAVRLSNYRKAKNNC